MVDSYSISQLLNNNKILIDNITFNFLLLHFNTS